MQMRILHIVEVLHVDGRTTLLRDLIRSGQFAAEHAVLCLKFPGPVADDFSRLGVRVLALGLNRPFHDFAQKIAAIASASKFKPDVCLCWSGGANLLSVVPWLVRTPVIWTIHNSFEKWQGQAKRLGITVLARLSGTVPYRVVCCSQATERVYRMLHRFNSRRLTTIENGVNTTKFRPDAASRRQVRSSLGIAEDQVVVATAARMSDPAYRNQGDSKDLDTLFSAVRIACRQRSDLRFIMFGTNIDEANLELVGLIREMQIEPFVMLLGFRKDVPDLLAAADLYAMSSVSEGLPLALIEAMSCGLIPVCTDAGGIRDAVADLGVIVPQKDGAALAEAILKVANMETKDRRRQSAALVEHVSSHFSIEQVAERYRNLIYAAVGERFKA